MLIIVYLRYCFCNVLFLSFLITLKYCFILFLFPTSLLFSLNYWIQFLVQFFIIFNLSEYSTRCISLLPWMNVSSFGLSNTTLTQFFLFYFTSISSFILSWIIGFSRLLLHSLSLSCTYSRLPFSQGRGKKEENNINSQKVDLKIVSLFSHIPEFRIESSYPMAWEH